MEPIPNNLIVSAFNYTEHGVYTLLNILGKSIRQNFKIIQYFGNIEDHASFHSFKYALFYSRLNYYNTDVFLIKNFYCKEKQQRTLFDTNTFETEYLVKLNPDKMYILLIYSDDIQTIQDVEQFIKAKQASIQLSALSSVKIIRQLHFSVQKYKPS
ncbi:MAG: hypothetical protein N2203_06530 [Bacteroidia bacterium]|nr:hypothetical protein [Bacteroidia bacterium]